MKNLIIIGVVCTWLVMFSMFLTQIDFKTNLNEQIYKLKEDLEELKSQYTLLETSATDEFDTIAEQRIQDAISFWVISLNKTQTEDLEKTIHEIHEEHIDLECMFDARDYTIDKNSFRFYLTQSLNDFVDIKPEGITCWRDWEEIDCKDFCEEEI